MARRILIKDNKTNMLTLRLDEADWEYLNEIVRYMKEKSGMKVTRTWIVLEMMRLGRKSFENSYLEKD